MKKLFVITLIIGIAVSMGTLGARAAQVSEGQARNIAAQFMAQKRLGSIDTASPSMLRGVASSQPAIYVFNTAKRGEGWVIVSGDDRALPVLGYSDHGYCDLDSVPENMREWLEMYVAQIESLDDGGSGNSSDALPVLGNVASNDAPMPKGGSVQPLITTKWGQGYPYNLYCPTINGTNCVTGCTATAMAQIMRYHQWPQSTSQNIPSYYWETGKEYIPILATTTFNWASMTDTYPSSGGNTTANNAVARIMQFCGRALQTDFGINSSSAYAYRNVWVDYFRYSSNAQYMYRCDYSYSLWVYYIKKELNNHRPILYRGQKSPGGGHAFVLDGYDENEYFHFNWGWSGNYDGYFSLESLNPKGGGIGSSPGENGYVIWQAMIIGLQPNTTAATEWNEVAKCSNVTAASTSYTRSSSTKPFGITVTSDYKSFATLPYTFDLGWGVYDETGHQQLQFFNCLPGQELGAGESKTFTRTLSFGANLPNGTYYLRPICRQSSSSSPTWTRCHFSGTEYIRATINGNNLTLEVKNQETKNGMIASINAFGTLKKVNRPLSVLVKVTNTRSISGSINLYLFADNVMVGSQAVTVEMGSSTTTSIKFIPKTSGTKSIKITADANGNNVLCTGSVTVDPATAANLSMTYYVTGANSTNNHTSLDYSLPFNITIKNNNSAVYHDYVIVNLYRYDTNELIDTKSIICNIAAGEQMSKTFTFENLQLGKYYAKVYYYNYNDQVQALHTIYYTVAEPYDVWVNGVRVHSANKNSVTGPSISGTITYLPSTNTLTLNNATLDIRGMSVNAITNAYGGSPNLKIKLVGTNKILAEAYKIAIDVKESQGFTLYGSGTLTCGGALYLDARDHMTNNNTKSYIKDCSVDINQIISEDYEESLIIDNADVTTEYLNVGGDYNGNVGLKLLNCRVVSPKGGYTKDGCIYVGNEVWYGHVEIKRGTASTIPGDVNGDGHVTSADITALYNWLINSDDSELMNGDQDGDGHVTSVDVTVVYNIMLDNQ